MIRLLCLVALLFMAGCVHSPEQINRYAAAANKLVARMDKGDYAAIGKMFSPEMQQALPLEETTKFFASIRSQHGTVQRLGEQRRDGEWVVLPVHFERGELEMKIALDHAERISGLYFGPADPLQKAPARNETTLSLPFKDKWLVFWGGETREVNYHHDTPDQKFAFDLVGVGENGKTRRGLSQSNEDYFAFGREVLAPGDGAVVKAIDGVRDNEPGSMNPYSVVGNCVTIQHCTNEFSVLAHFKCGTVRVKAGDNVKRGDVLGLCGNSGNSSEPHLHYHLMHTSRMQDGLGIKTHFNRVIVEKDGRNETGTDYSPVKSEIISP